MRVKSVKELPSWFSLKRYEELADLSEEECWDQVTLRFYLEECLSEDIEVGENNFTEDAYFIWRAIECGVVLIESQKDYMTEEERKEQSDFWDDIDRLQDDNLTEWQRDQQERFEIAKNKWQAISSTRAICGLRVDLADAISQRFREKNLIIDEPKNKNFMEIESTLFFSDVNLGARMFDIDLWGGDSVFVQINLDSKRDDEIISDFSRLLPKWREEMQVTEPDRVKIKPSFYKKIVAYRVVPYLDLRLWEKNNGFSIPYSVMAAALFPDGERGDTDLRQTVRSYIQELRASYDQQYD